MDSELLNKLKAGISDLLIRYPLYRFRKKQGEHDRLRVLVAAQKEYLFAALSQILPNGQLLDTRLEVTVCGAAPDDREALLNTIAPDLRRFVSIAGMDDITETTQPLAWLTFHPDFPGSGSEEWDYVLICDGRDVSGWSFDPAQLVAVMNGEAASVTFPERRRDIVNERISEEKLRQIAFNTHYSYQKYNDPRASMEEIQAKFQETYNSSATLENVMHIRSKLACCDILDSDLPTAARRFAAYMNAKPEIVGRLAVVEHNRWMMEKIMKGFQLQKDPNQMYRRAGVSTHSATDNWHMCLLPSDCASRLTADDWRADPADWRPELDALDRMSLEVHHKCREIAKNNRKGIFKRLDFCVELIDEYSDSSMPDKAKAFAYLQSMHSAVSQMYQKKRIAAHRYDRSKQDLLKLLKGDVSNSANDIRQIINSIDRYLEPLREYIIDKDYKEQDYLMVKQIPFALTHRSRMVLVKFFDIDGKDCQFAPWQLEPSAITYIGFADTANRLDELQEKAVRIRNFLAYSCNKVAAQFHVLVDAGVSTDCCDSAVLTAHPLHSNEHNEIIAVFEQILGGQMPDYMETTDCDGALLSAAQSYADSHGIGTFNVKESRICNSYDKSSSAEELMYPAPVKGITVLEMFEQAGAVLAGCESSRLSDLSNVYRQFWEVSQNASKWNDFCMFISDAYKEQKAEHKYSLYKSRPKSALEERTVRMNAQVLKKLMPAIREMEEQQYLCGIRIEWIVGDTMALTFQIHGRQPADRMVERLSEITRDYKYNSSYHIKWIGDRPEIQVKKLSLRDARLPENDKEEFEQLLKELEKAHVINNLTICNDVVCLDFAVDEFLFSLRNSGKVLEYYVYYTALQECQFDDAEVSWSFFHSAGENAAKNELDIICTKGTSSLFISAKYVNTETFEDSSFLNNVCYEVSVLADNFGIHATRVLAAPRVKQFENGKLGHYVKRAESRGVYLLGDICFKGKNLSRVLDRIARGDENWCQFLLDEAESVRP